MGTFLTLCSKRSAGEHVEITEEPIRAWLLFNRKPIISCDRTTPKRVISFPTFLVTYGKQIPNPCFVYGRNSEKNRRKQLFSMQFSVNPSGENKSVWQEFSGHRTLNWMRCGNRFECAGFRPATRSSATSGYFVLKKLKLICDPFRRR